MLPQRPLPSEPSTSPQGARRSGTIGHPGPVNLDALKRRVVAKLEDRLDLGASKRMPQSLLRQSLRQQADQIVEAEGRGLSKPDRDRLVDEVLGELFGYGPLEELFADATVREIMVSGPGLVIVRRDGIQWSPSHVRFRDEGHVRAVLDRIAAHADAVGPVMASVVTFDMKLPNGFRALAVVPPEALEQAASAVFVRERAAPPVLAPEPPPAAPTGSASNGTVRRSAGPATGSASSGSAAPAATRSAVRASPIDSPAPGERDPLARHRSRIVERLLSKFAALKVYDLSRLDAHELERIIAAYVREYGETERVYISDPDQGRLTLEILTALRR